MLDNEKLNFYLRRARRVRPYHLGVAFTASALVTVFALRANNLQMAKLRTEVQKADESGGDVQGALQRLQEHVLHHMNTSVGTGSVYPPIQLKETYSRLEKAEQARVQAVTDSVYTEAQNYCESQNTDFSGRGRVDCVQQYVQDHKVEAKTYPTSLYQFDFVAPKWSPDFAGWSLVITILIGIALLIRVLLGWWYKKRA
jgi:preprotein translocase subunit SecF